MKFPVFAYIIVLILALTPYVNNAYDLSQCDFESPYRCEVIHGVGVALPPTSLVTMWFDNDADQETE